MKKFDKLVQEAISRIPEDEVLSSDLATIKGKAGELKLNGGMKIAGQRSDDYKKAMHTYRVCNVCGTHTFMSNGRYPNNCSNCGDPINTEDIEQSVKESSKEFDDYIYDAINKEVGPNSSRNIVNKILKLHTIDLDNIEKIVSADWGPNITGRIMKNIKDLDLVEINEGVKEEYQEFFEKKLKQWKIKSPSELSKEDKAKFFKEVEDEYKKEDPKTDDGDE